ncbi:MAG: hypothetical protein D6785_08465, partial [Planctomycetota bacterium]
MTIQDLIDLKEMGYQDKDILQDLKKNKTQFPPLSAKDLEKLKKKGFSPEILAYLKRFQKQYTLSEVIRHWKESPQALQMLQWIRKNGIHLSLTPLQSLQALKQGLPLSVILALKKEPLKISSLRLLGKRKTEEKVFLFLIEYLGLGEKVSPKDGLQLYHLGVSKAVIKALAKAKIQTKSLTAPAKHSSTSGTKPKEGWKKYYHPAGQFVFYYPQSWKAQVDIVKGKPRFRFIAPKEEEGFLELVYFIFSPASRLLRSSMDECLSWFLPEFYTRQSLLKVVGKGKPLSLAKGKGRGKIWNLAGIESHSQKKVRGQLALILQKKGLYSILFLKPANGALQGAKASFLSKVAHKFQGGYQMGKRLSKPLSLEEVVDKFKESVVSIKAYTPQKSLGGTGTGFIVRSDGYILTNHHVVYDAKNKRFHTKFEISWDSSLGRETVEAKLVGAKKEKGNIFVEKEGGKSLDLGLAHRADIALLK